MTKRWLIFSCFLLTNVLTAFGQVNFTSSNLPIFIINTDSAIVDEPKVGANLGIINNLGQRNNLTDIYNDYDGRIGIELRGQTSQSLFDKKSYGFETRDGNDADESVSLLGLPEEEDWILYGPFSDKTLMRNVLIFELSNQIGMYASRTKYCELVLNGEYQGVYILMEKIKRDKNRVDIAKLTPDEISGTDISGGYMLRLDKYSDSDQNLFPSTLADANTLMLYQVIYPKDEDLQPEQFQYIKDFMHNFETALRGNNYQDAALGFRQYIDVNSFVDFLLLNELGRNPDAYRLSTYFHKTHDDDGGKLKMGPIWDFNLAMGNANFCLGGEPTGWVLNYNQACPDDYWLIGYWWDRLLTDKAFALQVVERWQTLRQTTFSLANIHQMIDDKAAYLEESQTRNFQQWNILNEWIWPNNYVGGTYQKEVEYLKDWFGKRVEFMDKNISEISWQVRSSSSNPSFKLYPNPFLDELTIEIQEEIKGAVTLTFFNFMGQKVTEINIEVISGVQNKLKMPNHILSQLSSGVYFYTFEINGVQMNSGKLMKE